MKDKTPFEASRIYDRALACRIAGGNPRIAADLLARFLEELPLQQDAIRRAYAQGDLNALRELAHKLRGSATYCAALELQAAAQALEFALAEAAIEILDPAYEQVMASIQRLRAHFGRLG